MKTQLDMNNIARGLGAETVVKYALLEGETLALSALPEKDMRHRCRGRPEVPDEPPSSATWAHPVVLDSGILLKDVDTLAFMRMR